MYRSQTHCKTAREVASALSVSPGCDLLILAGASGVDVADLQTAIPSDVLGQLQRVFAYGPGAESIHDDVDTWILEHTDDDSGLIQTYWDDDISTLDDAICASELLSPCESAVIWKND